MTVVELPVYDSARRPTPVVDEVRTLWRMRGLLRLLVARDLVLRYKRSLLGVWWTLLNPLLTMLVLWLVFSNLFRLETEVPYAVYLLSGIVLYTFFDQVVNGAGTAMLANAGVLSKIHVPPIVLCAAAAAAAAVNFLVGMLPLLAIMIISGVVIPASLPAIVLPCVLLLAFGVGVGLVIAPLAVRYQDTMQLTQLGLLLGLYATPVLWPPSIVPGKYADLVGLNPLWHFLRAFRESLYGGGIGPWTSYAVMVIAAVVSLGVGALFFHRTWRRTVVML